MNVLLEVTWTGAPGAHDFVVNPGVRWAHNLAGGLEIVPGLAFPDLSFEHRFKPADRP